jgi:hypothetical protein
MFIERGEADPCGDRSLVRLLEGCDLQDRTAGASKNSRGGGKRKREAELASADGKTNSSLAGRQVETSQEIATPL